jgi:hypothetical protein
MASAERAPTAQTRMERLAGQLRFAWRRFFHWRRLLGLAVIALAGYLLIFVVLGRTDVSWVLPQTSPHHFEWPVLSRFLSWKETAPDGGQETVYSVPSRRLTPGELNQLEATNGTTAPAR